MHALVVHAHPVPDSYSHALCRAVVAGLESAGHEVEVIDLYAIDYRPWMTEDEHRSYDTIAEDHPDPVVAEHIERVEWADALVLVFPTWWSGLPAIMKGWIDRTMLPGVAFRLDDRTQKVRGNLQIRHLVGVTTYGSPAWYLRVFGNAGRRTVMRTIRLICPRSTKRTWLDLDSLDGHSESDRRAFLEHVEESLRTLEPRSTSTSARERS